MKVIFYLLNIFYFVDNISGAFIECKRKDPKLNACLFEQINKNWLPNFEKAYPQYGVPTLDPHHLGDIKIVQGNNQVGLNFTASDVYFYGLKGSKIEKVDLDTKNKKFTLAYFNKKMVNLNHYEAKGKILLFPINGHGKGNITNTDVVVKISFNYDIVPDAKSKVKYVKVKNFQFKVKPGKGFLNFENLFNGDKYLSKQINDVINDNSNELMPSFQPSVEAALQKAWNQISDDFFSKIPYDELFMQ